MRKKTVKQTLYDVVNVLFSEYRETGDIIGDRGILTELNDRHGADDIVTIGNSHLSLQRIPVKA